ncbi:type IV fimbrial biogenesis protein FimT [Vibrio sp. ES.051]|uniref:pilus assembly FimT family protein n=1 Tax=Vibrio sp. ES.051 TaxID=1761909 RepID=UPI000BF54C0C|nr:GspH/FimT family pseudopilin [Vibrio sp. ES.051]PFG46167.1 type IV fimbrial biogenesis protein FimT [Vibrio sp. ES.051]
MPRGFTLLELLITVSVLSILLVTAAPSFSHVSQTVQMQSLATELVGFLSQSKSEAVMRNKKLYVRFSIPKDTEVQDGAWSLRLMDTASGAGNTILNLSGSAYSDLSVKHNFANNNISFDEVRGRPKRGRIEFFSTADQNLKLNAVLSNPPGRIKVCSQTGSQLYDYPKCPK